jgi:hypothetical protein
MPHAESQIFMPVPGYSEEVDILLTLGRDITVLNGRVAVLMDPIPETLGQWAILAPGGKHYGKFRPDSGTVVSSGVADLQPGDRVIVKPYDGLWYERKDNPVIPEGRQVRFYGVGETWWRQVVAKIEDE